ncbi:MAG: extracellular solute-binding protein [Patescibacteria group bacterium]|nr:extracellular solute-binding protein [Patescibacteria group bacterium]
MKTKKLILLLIFILLITSGFQCTANKKIVNKPVTLTVWGVYEDRDALELLFNKFTNSYPTVTFEYRQFSAEEYENQLLNAWADDRGPDIYFLPNTLLRQYKEKGRITAMPASVKLPLRQVKISGISFMKKTDIIDSLKNVNLISRDDLDLKFANVVTGDVYIDNKIYGLPLSLETLAMFYNRDMLDDAGIPKPPIVWSDEKNSDDFVDQVKKITQLKKDGSFKQSGTALGTINNITNASDIIALFLMQADTNFANARGTINLSSNKKITLAAINFYNDFSNPVKDIYSWNKDQSNSLEAFKGGQTAFFFGYPYHKDQISQNQINYGISTIPQLQYRISQDGEILALNPVNIANYWVMTVSHRTKKSDIAWGFIDFATKKENVKVYLEKSEKPTALRDLIKEQSKNIRIAPFVNQILSAKSWYKGTSPELAKRYLEELTDRIKSAGTDSDINAIIESYQSKINQTIK